MPPFYLPYGRAGLQGYYDTLAATFDGLLARQFLAPPSSTRLPACATCLHCDSMASTTCGMDYKMPTTTCRWAWFATHGSCLDQVRTRHQHAYQTAVTTRQISLIIPLICRSLPLHHAGRRCDRQEHALPLYAENRRDVSLPQHCTLAACTVQYATTRTSYLTATATPAFCLCAALPTYPQRNFVAPFRYAAASCRYLPTKMWFAAQHDRYHSAFLPALSRDASRGTPYTEKLPHFLNSRATDLPTVPAITSRGTPALTAYLPHRDVSLNSRAYPPGEPTRYRHLYGTPARYAIADVFRRLRYGSICFAVDAVLYRTIPCDLLRAAVSFSCLSRGPTPAIIPLVTPVLQHASLPATHRLLPPTPLPTPRNLTIYHQKRRDACRVIGPPSYAACATPTLPPHAPPHILATFHYWTEPSAVQMDVWEGSATLLLHTLSRV